MAALTVTGAVLDGATVGWLGALHPNLQKRLDRPQQRAVELARKVASQPPLSVAMTKLTVNRLTHALDDLLPERLAAPAELQECLAIVDLPARVAGVGVGVGRVLDVRIPAHERRLGRLHARGEGGIGARQQDGRAQCASAQRAMHK